MSRVAVDFGTGNTVVARWRDGEEEPATLEVEGVTVPTRGRRQDGGAERTVHLAPSVIHFGAARTLIGRQVAAEGLEDHPETIRWMKRGVAYGVTKRKKTAQGHKGPAEAGAEFLRRLLLYLAEEISFADDEFTFTAPVEAFEPFRDWLARIAESLGIRRARFLDETTAAILAHQGAVRPQDRFLVVDFGCGTLDAAAVRLDLAARQSGEVPGERCAVQLGQAGRELGGLDIDRWLADDFAARLGFDPDTRRRLKATLIRKAEAAKIALSEDPVAHVELRSDRGAVDFDPAGSGTGSLTYAQSCDACERGLSSPASAPSPPCFGCILLEKEFARNVRDTIDRALENAAIKAGMRRSDLTAVVVTGGTSLVPAVRRLLDDAFAGKVRCDSPFDAVARGACKGWVAPILQHDYAVESYDAGQKAYRFQPLFSAGTEYPTPPAAVRLWARGTFDGMTRIGIQVFEVSKIERRTLEASLVDEGGALIDASKVSSGDYFVCLNRENPTFIPADPPIVLARDARRFLCSFRVDADRKLLVTVQDQLAGRTLLEDRAVVRL
jgi:molecular chaperone DnaK (HSP70)